jgi:fucose permease
MATISVVILKDMQSSVAETAVTMSFAIMGSTIASYVFGVVWQDNTITQSGKLDDGLADR